VPRDIAGIIIPLVPPITVKYHIWWDKFPRPYVSRFDRSSHRPIWLLYRETYEYATIRESQNDFQTLLRLRRTCRTFWQCMRRLDVLATSCNTSVDKKYLRMLLSQSGRFILYTPEMISKYYKTLIVFWHAEELIKKYWKPSLPINDQLDDDFLVSGETRSITGSFDFQPRRMVSHMPSTLESRIHSSVHTTSSFPSTFGITATAKPSAAAVCGDWVFGWDIETYSDTDSTLCGFSQEDSMFITHDVMQRGLFTGFKPSDFVLTCCPERYNADFDSDVSLSANDARLAQKAPAIHRKTKKSKPPKPTKLQLPKQFNKKSAPHSRRRGWHR